MDKFSIIDCHIDVLYALKKENRTFSSRSEIGHCDLPRMKEGNFQAAFFALFPAKIEEDITNGMIEWFDFVNNPENKLYHIKKIGDFAKAQNSGKIGAIMHFEGAGGIDFKFKLLKKAYNSGLRSMGLTHANVNNFGTGVIFKGEQIDSGLTKDGIRLVKEMQEMGITVDASHLNDRSFWDLMGVITKPVIASHSNSREICGILRNLTDNQIKAIKECNGVIGINFGSAFLIPRIIQASSNKIKTPIEPGFEIIKKHIDHIVEIAGIESVAIGSDFDGVKLIKKIKDCSKIQELFIYLAENGYSRQDLEKISQKNVLRVFKETWKN